MSRHKGTRLKGDAPEDIDRRIKAGRAALNYAIKQAGDIPLSLCPEVLQLSRELDALINVAQGNTE